MTPRERVINALEHRQPDQVPWTVSLTQQEHRKLIEYTGNEAILNEFGSHIAEMNFYSKVPVQGRPGFIIDHFGVVWNRTVDKDIGIVDRYLLSEPEISRIIDIIPPVQTEERARHLDELAHQPGEPFRLCCIGFSLFERAWSLRGMDNLLMDMVDNPEFVDALLAAIAGWDMQCVEMALQYDIDGVHFGDDWGMQRGLIMGPKLWRRFIKPHLARLYGRIRQAGKYVTQHSCGDISEIYPDLVEIGLHAHQTFQPEIYDIEAVKKQYAGKLAFWGGISTQRLLPFATPDVVKSETARIMGIMGRGGGYIAAPTHAVPPDVPAENIMAMVEVFQNQDKWVRI